MNSACALELPLLVRSVVSAGGRIFLTIFSPNLKKEILDVLAPFSIISAFTCTEYSRPLRFSEVMTNLKQHIMNTFVSGYVKVKKQSIPVVGYHTTFFHVRYVILL